MKNTKYFLRNAALLLAFSAILFFQSCKKDDDNNNNSTPKDYKGVLVINEGGFLKGNSSVSYYNPDNGNEEEDAFKAANNRPLGDIFQSVEKINGKLYLVVNNSGKIEVVDPVSLSGTGQITGLGSPRYILAPGGQTTTAYVTDLFAGAIHIVNLTTNTKTGSIALPGWSEKMVEANGRVYVNNYSNNKIYLINPAGNIVDDSIALSGPPVALVKDKNGKLWVLADSTGSTKAKFMRINPAGNSVEATIEFAQGQSASRVEINGSSDKIYFLGGNGAYAMDITATALPSTPIKTGFFYGLGVDPKDGSVYLGDPLNFSQRGTVYRIKTDNSESSFKAGIAPSGFYFNY